MYKCAYRGRCDRLGLTARVVRGEGEILSQIEYYRHLITSLGERVSAQVSVLRRDGGLALLISAPVQGEDAYDYAVAERERAERELLLLSEELSLCRAMML